MEIARRHEAEDSRVKIMEHTVNKGLGAARNTGISAANGRYIMFLDSDDCFCVDSAELLHEKISSGGAQMAFGRMAWCKNRVLTPVEYIDSRIRAYELLPDENLRYIDAQGWYIGNVCNRIYDTSWIKRKEMCFPVNVFWEDVPFSTYAWFEAEKIGYIPHIVYLRTERMDESNPSITQDYSLKKFLDRDIIEKAVFDYFCGKPLEKVSINNAAVSILNRICGATKSIVPNANQDIKSEVEEWLLHYEKRHEQMITAIQDRLK